MTTPRFTQLADWLTWMETLHPSEIDLGLGRIKVVAARLGIDKGHSTVITVAGTNGKGSCVRSLERLLCSRDKRVGIYTSPHIISYNERIQVNERLVEDDEICAVFERIDRARGDLTVTYFEFATLAALLIFQQRELDYWILEVGLGGRLDAVNIIDPDVAVITSIDVDHEKWLGDTREKIAVEKLGILRRNILCVCAEDAPTDNMDLIFTQQQARVFRLGQEFFQAEQFDDQGQATYYSVQLQNLSGEQVGLHLPTPQLPPKSLAAALQVLTLLDELPEAVDVYRQVQNLRLDGRFECREICGAPFVFDVAHNPAAGVMLAKNMGRFANCHVVAVVGMLADKKIYSTLEPLVEHVDTWLACELRDVLRAESSHNIAGIVSQLGVSNNAVSSVSSVEAGIEAALSIAKQHDTQHECLVLVFGSFYTVSAAKMYVASVSNECKK